MRARIRRRHDGQAIVEVLDDGASSRETMDGVDGGAEGALTGDLVFAMAAWICRACRCFNGEAKERLDACRACGGPRP